MHGLPRFKKKMFDKNFAKIYFGLVFVSSVSSLCHLSTFSPLFVLRSLFYSFFPWFFSFVLLLSIIIGPIVSKQLFPSSVYITFVIVFLFFLLFFLYSSKNLFPSYLPVYSSISLCYLFHYIHHLLFAVPLFSTLRLRFSPISLLFPRSFILSFQRGQCLGPLTQEAEVRVMCVTVRR